MSETKFTPARGRVVIVPDVDSETTSAGIIYSRDKRGDRYKTGIVASIGHPEISPNGVPLQVEYKEGDRVMFEALNQSTVHNFVVIKQDQVNFILDEGVEIVG